MCTPGYAERTEHLLTQNQLTELFESDQIKGLIERSEERGWVEPAELEAFVLEHELNDEEAEQITRELETIGLEVGQPQADADAKKQLAEPSGRRKRPKQPSGRPSRCRARPTRSSSSSPMSAATSC